MRRIHYIWTTIILIISLFLIGLMRFESITGWSGTTNRTKAIIAPSTPITTPSALLSLSGDPRLALIEKVFNTPITFYGKVVDQYGQPVSGADVNFSVVTMNDAFNTRGMGSPDIHSKSNSSGCFSLSNSHGASLTVAVFKTGYYYVDKKSTQNFGYGLAPDSERKAPPTVNDPAIFLLWKKGTIEHILKKKLSINFKIEDSPLIVNLLPGNNQVNLKIDVVSEVIPIDTRLPDRPYDWSSRVSILGGGLQQYSDLYITEAPDDNYKDAFSVKVLKTDPKWDSGWKGNFFVRFPGNYYGRIFIEILANQGIYPRVRITSYVNPNPGSRNLDSEDNVPYDN